MRYKTGVLGHFGRGEVLLNGQTVKTEMLTDELIRQYGREEIFISDTHGGKRKIFEAPFQAIGLLKKCKNIVVLPAQNGLRIYIPLLAAFSRFFGRRGLHYVVIGGWLADFVKDKKLLKRSLAHFDGIYVETETMKAALEKQGFSNVFVMPNFKKISPLKPEELVFNDSVPYRLCTFSRVMKQKGIEDAVNAVKKANESMEKTVFTLDIYGQVEAAETEWFENLQKEFPEYIAYKGGVSAEKSVEVLKDCFALLFPTRFFTEGIPGTVLDAFSAGVPVISSRWESFEDVIDDGVTGVGYTFGNNEELQNILFAAAKTPERFLKMKVNCLAAAEKYLPQSATKVLTDNFI